MNEPSVSERTARLFRLMAEAIEKEQDRADTVNKVMSCALTSLCRAACQEFRTDVSTVLGWLIYASMRLYQTRVGLHGGDNDGQ